MIHSVRFIAVLDTNVIYPVVIRDLLFWFAHYELYTPKCLIQTYENNMLKLSIAFWSAIVIQQELPV